MSGYRSPDSEEEEGEDGCDDESGSVATQAQLLRKGYLTMVNEASRKSCACLHLSAACQRQPAAWLL
jgi:hypothetical protein